MPHYYIEGHEVGPAYEFDTDPGAPYVLWEPKAVKAVTEQAPAPENEV